MEKHVDTMKQTVELAETCLEGIGHIRARLNEGYMQDTVLLLQDVVVAFYQMQKSIYHFADHLAPNRIEESTANVRKALDHVVSSYEKVQGGKALEIIQFNLLPSYKKWKAELEQTCAPYFIS